MSLLTPAKKLDLPGLSRGMECRVSQRFSCDVDTVCQPIAARGAGELNWRARIKDVSAGGIGLVASRRFEPGTGLAIQIPLPNDPEGETYLVKVVRVQRALSGEW